MMIFPVAGSNKFYIKVVFYITGENKFYRYCPKNDDAVVGETYMLM